VFEASTLEAKARPLRPRLNSFEAKVKAAVFEVNEVLALRQQAD